MAWIKVDDSFYDNDKMLAAGTIGRDMYWHGMAYCNRNLTDGLIPKGRALALVGFTGTAVLVGMGGVDGQDCAPVAIERLLDADLWHEDGHDCPTCMQPGPRHYIVHDYLEYQFSKAQIQEKAEANRERVRKWSDKRKSETNAVTNALATQPLTEQLHDNPNPNPNPSTSPLVKKGGEVALGNAREPASRPICSKHPNGNDKDENCRGCMKCRQWDESRGADEAADELHAKRLARELAEQCPDCHGTHHIDVGENEVIKCHHQQIKENA
jgi:hypothetical protein